MRIDALTTPDSATVTRPSPASTEYRVRTVCSRGAGPCRRRLRPRPCAPLGPTRVSEIATSTSSPPTHTTTPSRCRPIEFTAPLWSSPPAACPIRARGTRASIARMPVQNRPLWERTAIANVVTTAAITVTQNHAWPTEMPTT